MTTALGLVGGKLAGILVSRFRTLALERLSKYRQEAFVETLSDRFRDELFHGESEEAVERLLDDMLKKEALAEAVFDAFRRVSLSRSREIGPRIIGYLTAGILAEDRLATEDEERWFDAAESMSDFELLTLVQTFEDWNEQADQGQIDFRSDNLGVGMEVDHQAMDDSRQGRIESSGLTGGMDPWMRKLAVLGLVYERTLDQRKRYEADTDRGIDEPFSQRTMTWWLVISKEVVPLIELIKRADTAKKARLMV